MPRLATPSSSGPGPSRAVRALAVLVAVSVVLVTLYFREGPSGPVHLLRSGAQTLATPFRLMGAQVARPFSSVGNAVRNATSDAATLSELEADNAELTQRLAQMTEYEQQNARLEALLGLTSTYAMSGTGAHVVSYSTDSWTRTVTIDKGSLDGVAPDMPVVSGSGVFGQVVEVAATTSTVRLLADPSSGVSAEVQGSGATGVLSGSVDGTLRLRYVSSSSQVAVGDTVITSGLGGVYPRGLLLGTVASCTASASGMYYDITLTPGVAVGGYAEVFVVSSFDAASAASSATVDQASAPASVGEAS